MSDPERAPEENSDENSESSRPASPPMPGGPGELPPGLRVVRLDAEGQPRGLPHDIDEATRRRLEEEALAFHRRKPFAVLGLIATYVLIALGLPSLEVWLQGDGGAGGAQAGGLVDHPLGIGHWLESHFAHERVAIWEGEYWRFLSATFLHGGVWHLLLNCLALYSIGRVVERWTGTLRFLAYFFICALLGAFFFQSVSGDAPGVGASGGIFGVFGLFSVPAFSRRSPSGPILGRRFWTFLCIATVAIFLEGALVSAVAQGVEVAVSAHLGGFIGGLFLGYLSFLPPGRKHQARRGLVWSMLALVVLGAGLYSYFPFRDWRWQKWRADHAFAAGEPERALALLQRAEELGGDLGKGAIIGSAIEHGDLDGALEQWRGRDFEDTEPALEYGYRLADALLADGREAEADEVFGEIIEIADRAVAANRRPELLNSAAWFRAIAGRELEVARVLAREAVGDPRPPEEIGLNEKAAVSAYLNTLGWIQCLEGSMDQAIENLSQARILWPILPANHLYLALAYQRLGERDRVRQLVIASRRLDGVPRELGLSANERRLLEELEASLGGAIKAEEAGAGAAPGPVPADPDPEETESK